MAITALRWRPYRILFTSPFTTAHGTLTVREWAIVEIMTEEGIIGIGEIAPLPAIGGEELATALAPLPTLALEGRSLEAALDQIEQEELPPSTRCGLEIALFDALGKLRGKSVGELLAPPGVTPARGTLVNAVVGARSTQDAVTAALRLKKDGFLYLKLKMGISANMYEEIERIKAVEAAIGPKIQLRLDANEAWSFEQAQTILCACNDFGIEYVEQPLPAHDLAGMHALRKQVAMHIAADEAVRDLKSVRRILREEAADLLIIKPQLAGGLRAAQDIVREATKYNVRCVLTASLESGITLAATLHLAAATPCLHPVSGLATAHILRENLLREEIPIKDSFMRVPEGPGLGIKL